MVDDSVERETAAEESIKKLDAEIDVRGVLITDNASSGLLLRKESEVGGRGAVVTEGEK